MSYIPTNGWFDTVTTIGKEVAGGALSVYGEKERKVGEAEAYKTQLAIAQAQAQAQAQKRPSWLMPAAIGGVALIAIILLRK